MKHRGIRIAILCAMSVLLALAPLGCAEETVDGGIFGVFYDDSFLSLACKLSDDTLGTYNSDILKKLAQIETKVEVVDLETKKSYTGTLSKSTAPLALIGCEEALGGESLTLPTNLKDGETCEGAGYMMKEEGIVTGRITVKRPSGSSMVGTYEGGELLAGSPIYLKQDGKILTLGFAGDDSSSYVDVSAVFKAMQKVADGLACALADGLGGQGFGDVASQIAVEAVGEQLKGWFPVGKRRMTACVEEANRRVRRKQNEQSVPMMTTLSLLRTNGPYVHIAHVGDTRIYWFRDERILYQSTDHSVTQMMVTCGEISPEQVRGHASRNLLTRAIGYRAEVQAEYYRGRARHGDRLLLCTDGFWEWVLESDMLAASTAETPEVWLRRMCDMVRVRCDEDADNFSAIAITVE